MAARSKRKGGKGKIIIFIIEILIIIVMLGLLYFVMNLGNSTTTTTSSTLSALNGEELEEEASGQVKQGSITAEINEEVANNETMQGYMTIALFGVDAETDAGLYKGNRSDTIMIASINLDTGDIKLVSLYRDTFLNVAADLNDLTSGDYRKCNAAYSYGGAEQAVNMLNANLDLDIEKFITVGYKGLISVVDGLGGIYIDVSSEELQHINNYQITIANVLGTSYTPVTETGYQLLNGLQVAAYCRIRYLSGAGDEGNDYKRAGNQREVIMAIEEKAKQTDVTTLINVFYDSIGYIYTNLDTSDILTLISNISNYQIVDEGGIPQSDMRTSATIGAKGSCVIPLSLESNVIWLHNFLFDEEDYVVSETVKTYSAQIQSKTSSYLGN